MSGDELDKSDNNSIEDGNNQFDDEHEKEDVEGMEDATQQTDDADHDDAVEIVRGTRNSYRTRIPCVGSSAKLKPVVVLTDRKASLKMYIVHSTWINIKEGYVHTPMFKSIMRSVECEEMLAVLIQNAFAVGTKTVPRTVKNKQGQSKVKQVEIQWRTNLIKCLYADFRKYIYNLASYNTSLLFTSR